VEVFFNQRELAQAWGKALKTSLPLTEHDERRLVTELFSSTAEKNPKAVSLLKEKADYLIPAVAGFLLSYDIKNVVINGHFGPDGNALIPILTECLSKTLAPRFNYLLSYRPIEDDGFAVGAAMLFQNKYYDYSVLNKNKQNS
jgi:predicted NBD/HSP70 family sugar kinase